MITKEVNIEIVDSIDQNNILGAIPSTLYLCRMYDNGSAKLKIISKPDWYSSATHTIKIKISSNNVLIGLFNMTNDEFLLTSEYTSAPKLSVQFIITETSTLYTANTNIINFKLYSSIDNT